MNNKDKIPFDLEKAKAGEECVDNEGCVYTYATTFRRYKNRKEHIFLLCYTDKDQPCYFDNKGYMIKPSIQLYMKPKTRKVWVNLWEYKGVIVSSAHVSIQQVNTDIESFKHCTFLKTIETEVEI